MRIGLWLSVCGLLGASCLLNPQPDAPLTPPSEPSPGTNAGGANSGATGGAMGGRAGPIIVPSNGGSPSAEPAGAGRGGSSADAGAAGMAGDSGGSVAIGQEESGVHAAPRAGVAEGGAGGAG